MGNDYWECYEKRLEVADRFFPRNFPCWRSRTRVEAIEDLARELVQLLGARWDLLAEGWGET